MALPSAKRPAAFAEEIRARVDEQQRAKIKLSFTKEELVLRVLRDWYINLKRKKELNPMKFKREVIKVCFKFKVVYERLPQDWIMQLRTKIRERCIELEKPPIELKLYRRKKKVVEDPAPPAPAVIRSSLERHRECKVRKGVHASGSSGTVKASNEAGTSKEAAKPGVKKILDYTNDPPPPSWLAAYAQGKLLPRVLTVYTGEDSNVLFYDYTPSITDSNGQEVKLAPQPRHGILELYRIGKGLRT